MTINKQLRFEVAELVTSVDNGMSKAQFISDCRVIAKSYGVGYGYLLTLVAEAKCK